MSEHPSPPSDPDTTGDGADAAPGAPNGHSGLPAGEAPRWFDHKRNVAKLIYALYAVCALVVLLDLACTKHGHYGFENIIGFHAAFGFVSFVGLVISATWLRRLLMRDEDYYGD